MISFGKNPHVFASHGSVGKIDVTTETLARHHGESYFPLPGPVQMYQNSIDKTQSCD